MTGPAGRGGNRYRKSWNAKGYRAYKTPQTDFIVRREIIFFIHKNEDR
jgi:hypothetical protein